MFPCRSSWKTWEWAVNVSEIHTGYHLRAQVSENICFSSIAHKIVACSLLCFSKRSFAKTLLPYNLRGVNNSASSLSFELGESLLGSFKRPGRILERWIGNSQVVKAVFTQHACSERLHAIC